jgi:DNA-binding SARP family transcriptional activator
MVLQVRLFGHLNLTTESGGPIPALRPRAQRLLVYLLLNRHKSIPRESAAFTLWPDGSEKEALGALRRALSDIRASLPTSEKHDWVIATREELGWNPSAPHWLDIEVFEKSVREGSAAALHEAVALYSSDLLTEFDDEWIVLEREQLRQAQFSALRHLAAHYRTLAEYDPALKLARQAVALDPLSESASRDLIAIYYEAGDRGSALAEYEHLRRRLRDELDVEPMAETEALFTAITAGLPLPKAQALTSLPTHSHSTVPAAPRLIGREPELATLSAVWTEVALGHGRMVIFGGEAGVGKTHLALTLANHVARNGGRALIGHCYEFEETLPYQAITEMLRSAAHLLPIADLSPPHRWALARLLPDVIDLPGDSAPASAASPEDSRAELFEALLQTVFVLARRQPVALLVEDAHWAAESTLDWLTYIAPRLSASRLLVAVTYRTSEVGADHTLIRLERRLAREGAVTTLALKPLSLEANRELVAQLSGLPLELAIPVADRLFAETAGNPFFLHEIVRGLIESGEIVMGEGRWTGAFIETASSTPVVIPESLRATIQARAQRLTEMARMFLLAAGVAGRTFQYAVVKHAGGWVEELALGAVENLLARGFIRESEPAGAFVFAHHLVQETIYADLTAPRRAYWHRRLAEATQALRPDDFETLAHHFAQAGDDDRARHYYVQAGDRARALVAMNDAAAHYRAALKRWPESDRAGQAEILYKLGQCQWVIFETQSALESYEAARALYELVGDHVKTGEMERQIGRMYWELGDRQAAWPHFLRALEILEHSPETVEMARALSSMSQMHMLAAEYDDAIIWGERALALATRLGAEDVVAHALNNVGVALINVEDGDVERGLSFLRDSLRRALALGLPHDACRAYFNMGEHLMGLCRYAEARPIFEELYAYATRVNARAFASNAIRSLAELDWWSGRWATTLARQHQMIEQTWGIWQVLTSLVLGHMYNDLGQAEAARHELEGTLSQAMKWGEIQTTVPHLGQLARAYAALELDSAALETIQQLLGLLDNNPYLDWASTMPLLFACCWYAARPDMLDAARVCLPRLERADRQFRSQETRAALAEGRGAVALAEGNTLEAIERFRESAAEWESLGRPYDHARALTGLGRAWANAGNAVSAYAVLDQASNILDSLATQLDDPELKQSFLNSSLVRDTRGLIEK